MGGMLIEDLVPDGLQDVYRKVYNSIGHAEDERVKLALISILHAVHKDTADNEHREENVSNVVLFPRPIAS